MESSYLPLRKSKDLFCIPLIDENIKEKYIKNMEETSHSLLRTFLHDKWRYIPLDKDNIQYSKDTSNMETSYRLSRFVYTINSTLKEFEKIFIHTSTDSFRNFMKKLNGKDFIDTKILYTFNKQNNLNNLNDNHNNSNNNLSRCSSYSSTFSDSNQNEELIKYKLDCSEYLQYLIHLNENDLIDISSLYLYVKDAFIYLNERISKKIESMDSFNDLIILYKVANQDKKIFISIQLNNNEIDTKYNKIKKYFNSKTATIAFLRLLCDLYPNWSPESKNIFKNNNTLKYIKKSVINNINHVDLTNFMTIKWALFHSKITNIKNDICIMDHIGNKIINDTKMYYWTFQSIDGNDFNCLPFHKSYGITRTNIKKFGIFWKPIHSEKLEIIVCGSFESKTCQFIMNSILTIFNKLDKMITDGRICNKDFTCRTKWIHDKERNWCYLCMKHFHTWRRKHHCRMCGEIICSDCSIIRNIELPVIGLAKLRLCKSCMSVAKNTPVTTIENKNLDNNNVVDDNNVLKNKENETIIKKKYLFDHINVDNYSPCSSNSSIGFYNRKDQDVFHYEMNRSNLSPSFSQDVDDSIDNQITAELESNEIQGQYNRRRSSANLSSDSTFSNSFVPTFSDVSINNNKRKPTASNRPLSALALENTFYLKSLEPHKKINENTQNAHQENTILLDKEKKYCILNNSLKPENLNGYIFSKDFVKPMDTNKNSTIFDSLCELACQSLECPIAIVGLTEYSIYSSIGLNKNNSHLKEEIRFFIDNIMKTRPISILDASKEPFNRNNKLNFKIRFFAGCPIIDSNNKNNRIGYICVADILPRKKLNPDNIFTMERLATLAVTKLEEKKKKNIYKINHSIYSDINNTSSRITRSFSASTSSSSFLNNTKLSDIQKTKERNDHKNNNYLIETEAKMRSLLLKSYETQRQIASGGIK